MHTAESCPLLEHDCAAPRNPMSRPLLRDGGRPLPRLGLMSFMEDALEGYAAQAGCRTIASYHSETRDFALYGTSFYGADICLVQAPVGAPAAAILADLLIASGVEALVACGGCGVLTSISSGIMLVPTAAVRDEGTSYHYVPPAREIALDPQAIQAAQQALRGLEVPFAPCKTWTTDGFFRETAALVDRRRGEGCEAVEMECAALAAVAQCYRVPFVEILYSGDCLCDPSNHEFRDWINDTGSRGIAFLAALKTLHLLDKAISR